VSVCMCAVCVCVVLWLRMVPFFVCMCAPCVCAYLYAQFIGTYPGAYCLTLCFLVPVCGNGSAPLPFWCFCWLCPIFLPCSVPPHVCLSGLALTVAPPTRYTADPTSRYCDSLEALVPVDANVPYDMKMAISAVVDEGTLFEIMPDAAKV